MGPRVYDDRACELGEGPLWHPARQQLFWFDILRNSLLGRDASGPRAWRFDRRVSAAGWIDADSLLVASETDLFRFDLETGAATHLVPLEAETPATRSNDGRADPFGGFWIGTMGKGAEPDAGAIYRFHRGELRPLFDRITIPNAICFAPDGRHAHFADSARRLVWRVALDAQGWPAGAPEVYLDHRKTGLTPDGAVIDTEGRFWCAEWGASRVACYDTGGNLVEELTLPVPQPSCPAFGGNDLSTLFVTTAREAMSERALADAPHSGMTFAAAAGVAGQQEHRVIL